MRKHLKFYITLLLFILFSMTTLISVGFSSLNQNLNIAGDVEYTDAGNMIKSWTYYSSTDFHSSTYKDKIKSIDFLDNKNIPANAVESWDVSDVTNSNTMFGQWNSLPNSNSSYVDASMAKPTTERGYLTLV